MRQEENRKRMKQIFDCLILLCGTVFIIRLMKEINAWRYLPALILVIVVTMVWAVCDFVLLGKEKKEIMLPESGTVWTHGVQKLVLLDGQDRPVKSWDMQGRISLIIGKADQSQEPDIDLSDCEYSSFIDFQHAVLNFTLDQWYIEDLESQNGVKVKKVEDGECYRVLHRPCKVAAGDILYIANTKLLLT